MRRLTHRGKRSSLGASEVRPILARMSLLTSQLADDAATAVEYQDPRSGCRLAVTDDEVDALLRQLFDMLLTSNWTHGLEQAIDAALLDRYYERFGDHAVAIAQQACYTPTGRAAMVNPPGSRRAFPCLTLASRSDNRLRKVTAAYFNAELTRRGVMLRCV